MATPEETPEYEEGRGPTGGMPGGGARVPEHPPDTPGSGRTAVLWIVSVLAILVIGVPVAWRLGALVYLGNVLGVAASIAVWVVWAIVFVALVWVGLSMWRRAA